MIKVAWKYLARILTAVIAIIFVMLIYAALVTRPMPIHSFTEPDKHLVIAHRGGAGLWPENTILSFENAVKMGVDVLEFDVRSTQDHKLVVIHDITVDRTTNGFGSVEETTWEALQSLDAGYNWTRNGGSSFPYRGKGLQIPSLEEVINAFPNIPMIIELKSSSDTARTRFSRIIDESIFPERKVIASFQSKNIKYIRTNNKMVATSSTASEVLLFWILNSAGLGFAYIPKGETMQIPAKYFGLNLATSSFISTAHRHNVDVYVWTVNGEDDMRRYIANGADGIITDYPDRLLKVLGRYSVITKGGRL